MANRWVWRHDGTLQCGMGQEEMLDEAREQLATIIGDDDIVSGEKRTLPSMIITLCGAPTGQVNAFELTESGFWLLFHGIVGPIGFRPWQDELPGKSVGGEVPFPSSLAARELTDTIKRVSIAGTRGGGGGPTAIDELYGRLCRVYNVGDELTKDHLPERFNVGLVRGRIKELWFG